MAAPILIAENLQKSYGDRKAVDGISLHVERGEILGLLGPNGAGKTTTISMLTGVLTPTGGEITVDGIDLRTQAKAAKAKMGLVPQELALYPTLSARQNLLFFGRVYGLKGTELRSRVDEVLEMVGLSDRADAAIATYSGGMKRRINIGAGLLHKPAVLFLDEPTVGVDPQSRNAIFEGVEELNRNGMTIVYTTHYMEEAQRLCHRVAIVDAGKIVALDSPTGLIRSLGGGIIVMGIGEAAVPGTDATTAGVATAGVASVIERASDLPAVKAVSTTDGHLKVETHRLQEALMGVLDITNKLNVSVTSLELLEPNLESVFLHLTGKTLRE